MFARYFAATVFLYYFDFQLGFNFCGSIYGELFLGAIKHFRLFDLQFQSILFPLKYCDDKSCVNTEIIGAWLLGLVVGFLPFAWHEDREVTMCFYHAVVCKNYQMFRFVCVVLVPFCIITTIYGMIYKVVLHQVLTETFLR
jgi:hypothetical protein